jgi:hypothetical protein
MKFYVTGRSSNYDLVKTTFERIKAIGHEVTFEWTALPMVKPYDEHQQQAGAFALGGIQGVIDADVYIIFTHADGNGVFTEFGAALASNVINGSPIIYAIGEDRSSAMFNYHPSIQWRTDIESVLKEVNE